MHRQVTSPTRLTRAESFLGIHFDFHAREIDTPVGRHTTPDMVAQIIEKIKPDYIQCDCKGHHGLSSYPTRVGNRAPVIVGDPLRVWRDVTASYGVALYVHYSALYDRKAVQLHPEWARIDQEGKPDPNVISLFSSYVEDLMIPQLIELIDDYQIDGVWADGDCWAAARDYSPAALEAFHRETGIETVPRSPTDPHYREFSEFHRETFRRYLRDYADRLHSHEPSFQVASNWAFSSFMPEPVTANVDFLSGDSAPIARSYARLEARCLARQGRPWDIMTWSFGGAFTLEGSAPVGLKSPAQLKQEAATILSLGAGYQSVSNQKLDGSIINWHLDLMADVAKFCRQRQRLCHNAESIPQIGLVHSGTAYYREAEPLFLSIGLLNHLLGTLESLLASQNSVDILMPHQPDRLSEYPLIILPDWPELPEGFREKLLDYVGRGGTLLVIGPRASRLFSHELDMTLDGEIVQDAVKFIEHDGQLDGHKGPYQKVRLGSKATQYGRLFNEFDFSDEHEAAASIVQYGKGRIAGLFLEYGTFYHNSSSSVARDFLNGLVRELFPQPLVEVHGSHSVDVLLTRKEGRIIVHLINLAGPHDSSRVRIFDEVPPIGPLEVILRLQKEPRKVTSEPGGADLAFSMIDGAIHTVVPRLDIHLMVTVEV